MNDREMIKGVYCEVCEYFEDTNCPIKSASPWSRYSYCSCFRDEKTGETIPEIYKRNN